MIRKDDMIPARPPGFFSGKDVGQRFPDYKVTDVATKQNIAGTQLSDTSWLTAQPFNGDFSGWLDYGTGVPLPVGWYLANGDTGAFTLVENTDKNYLKVTNTGPSHSDEIRSRAFTVSGATAYTINVAALLESGTAPTDSQFNVSLVWYTSLGAVGSISGSLGGSKFSSANLTTASVTVTAPAGVKFGRVSITTNGGINTYYLQLHSIQVTSGIGLDSPAFTGTPTAPTPPAGDNSTRLATTAFVQAAGGGGGGVSGLYWEKPAIPNARDLEFDSASDFAQLVPNGSYTNLGPVDPTAIFTGAGQYREDCNVRLSCLRIQPAYDNGGVLQFHRDFSALPADFVMWARLSASWDRTDSNSLYHNPVIQLGVSGVSNSYIRISVNDDGYRTLTAFYNNNGAFTTVGTISSSSANVFDEWPLLAIQMKGGFAYLWAGTDHGSWQMIGPPFAVSQSGWTRHFLNLANGSAGTNTFPAPFVAVDFIRFLETSNFPL